MTEVAGDSPSIAVARAVAAVAGKDPTELEPPLDRIVDTDALDELFRARHNGESRGAGRVTFDYCGYTVEVDSSGAVDVLGEAAWRLDGH